VEGLNWRSTKFAQTSFILVAAVILKGMEVIDDYTFGMVVAFGLGNYAHHDVKQKGI